jgi:parvulin-like peptidyl-prolyl isomerase
MKALKEPLLHFVIAGALLFGAYALVNRGEQPGNTTAGPIHIGGGEISWLRETFSNQWHRAPTNEELSGLVASLLEEELLAREARELGLDRDDTIVRRRLAQKLTFMVEDTSHIVEPTEEDLRRFYAANSERFQADPRVSFTQVFFNPERRQNADQDAKLALASFRAGPSHDDAASGGDPLLLEADFHDVDQRTLSNMFGTEFAAAVFTLRPGPWSGPIKSAFGVHLVRVVDLRPAEPRPFESVRDKVAEEWRHQREGEMKASYLAKLQQKYGVVIDDSVKPLLPSNAAGSVAQ